MEPNTKEAINTKTGTFNSMKVVTGRPFGINKIGCRIISIITVSSYEVLRNLNELRDQTLMHIDIYADYLMSLRP